MARPSQACLRLAVALAVVAFPATTSAQQPLQAGDAADVTAQAASLGLPPLPPLTADSPMDDIVFSDRHVVPPGKYASQSDGTPMTLHTGFIPGTADGTGTGFGELFVWGTPDAYNRDGPPHPLIVGYHGFGSSAASVDVFSELDDEANARNYAYLSITGLDDQLFGSPISQRNVTAAIQWMLDNKNIDPDRVYFCGFSMGGGVVSSYTARHRNPNGVMIAALGMVAASWDWTMAYNLGTGSLQANMENAFNFGGSPTSFPFNYQQSSVLYFDPGSYPPEPGTLVPELSMGRNLHNTPMYAVRDAFDINGVGGAQASTFNSYVTGLGATLDDNVVVCCGGPPDNHSWDVLDEVDFFDFIDGLTVERYPQDFLVLADNGGKISYVDLTPRVLSAFSTIDGAADDIGGSITLSNVENMKEVVLDVGLAGLSGIWPLRVTAQSRDTQGFTLYLTGFDTRPAYLLDATTGAIVPNVDSDPLTDTLIVEVPGNSTLDADVFTEANWTTDLITIPNPVAPGGFVTLGVDAPSGIGGILSITIVSAVELYTPIDGGNSVITAGLVPPSFILDLPLDINGDVSTGGSIPNDPAFAGLRLLVQSIVTDVSNDIVSISNLWGLRIE